VVARVTTRCGRGFSKGWCQRCGWPARSNITSKHSSLSLFLFRHSRIYTIVTFWKIQLKLNLPMLDLGGEQCVYTGESDWNPNSALESDQPQHDHPSTIAHQYPCDIFIPCVFIPASRIRHAFQKRCCFNLFTSYTCSHKLWKVSVSLIMSVLLSTPISSAPTG
jgi:hypothetical protein